MQTLFGQALLLEALLEVVPSGAQWCPAQCPAQCPSCWSTGEPSLLCNLIFSFSFAYFVLPGCYVNSVFLFLYTIWPYPTFESLCPWCQTQKTRHVLSAVLAWISWCHQYKRGEQNQHQEMDWWPLLCRFTVLCLASISVMRCFASARSARTCTWRTSAFQTWVSKISWWQPGRNPGYIQVSPCLFCNFLDCLETEDVIWHRARTCPQHAATIFSCLQYTRPLFYSSLPWIGAVQKVTLPLEKLDIFGPNMCNLNAMHFRQLVYASISAVDSRHLLRCAAFPSRSDRAAFDCLVRSQLH